MAAMFLRNMMMVRLMQGWADAEMARRPPDEIIARNGSPYIMRWYVMRHDPAKGEVGPNVYLHRFERSDSEEPHCHPFDNVSVVLRGAYREETTPAPLSLPLDPGPVLSSWRFEGDVISREASEIHAIREVDPGTISLFLTGPKVRDWGFYEGAVFIPHQQFRAALADRQPPPQNEPDMLETIC